VCPLVFLLTSPDWKFNLTTDTAHVVDGNASVRTTAHPFQQIDFTAIRRALKTIEDREALGEFIKAGWTAPEFAEYARSWKPRNKTKPTSQSYQSALLGGPAGAVAQKYLERFRAPGFVMPPLDRPNEPPPVPSDHPEHPSHTAELKADVESLARRFMARYDDRNGRARRPLDTPISTRTWKSCFNELKRHGSLDHATDMCGLSDYRDVA
jgi:hypothetical protein